MQVKTGQHRLRTMLAAALVLVAAGGLLYFDLRPREPVYQGKTAAEWFAEFQKASSISSTYWRPFEGQPQGMSRVLDMEGLLRDPAMQGLKGLGTNAALFLGNMFAQRHGVLARTYFQTYMKTPAALKKLLPVPQAFAVPGDAQIFWALKGLQEDAWAAGPFIIAGIRDADRLTLDRALPNLRDLRFPPDSLDKLLRHWTSQGRHEHVLRIVSELQIRSLVAASCLSRALSSATPATRDRYLYELEKFGTNAVIALPEITASLKDSDGEVRYAAARAIGAIGIEAASAAGSLRQATNDKSLMVQRAAARALHQMQAE